MLASEETEAEGTDDGHDHEDMLIERVFLFKDGFDRLHEDVIRDDDGGDGHNGQVNPKAITVFGE